MSDKQAARAGMLPPPEISSKMEEIAEELPDIDFAAAATQLKMSSLKSQAPTKDGGDWADDEEEENKPEKTKGDVAGPTKPARSSTTQKTRGRGQRGRGGGKGSRTARVSAPPKLASVFEQIDQAQLPDPSLNDPVTSEQLDRVSEVSSQVQAQVEDHEDKIERLFTRLEEMEKSHSILLNKHTLLQKEHAGLKAQLDAIKRGPSTEWSLGDTSKPGKPKAPAKSGPSDPRLSERGVEPAPKPLPSTSEGELVAKPTGRRRVKY
ncbi:ORF1 [Fusarium oxysporum mymonavirus 1]|uniref:ORF1 n=1 Tax=Fusarium oxysporum mymonavirus 1 TaxID=2928187 RepID=A0AAX3A7L9_9MONO|nr:ORF1 [Fusarium oxysporum mymonavirus 1]UNQ74997.1 ORF1 [Fusarium oxysporum mymonavirus 1]